MPFDHAPLVLSPPAETAHARVRAKLAGLELVRCNCETALTARFRSLREAFAAIDTE